ncbi:uncharacterized protein YhaN [Halanaerobium saccharolyticum]|jgi:uncharacterized protein YhaN|uniref:Uncharacterized protein YhaN n=1 Tax=Halanaerobium saccharolyticum TaxID=43595 RepID=A0A4R7YPT5_9FIRM|nr:AAA family ATPase [Halanaerobium saccharolyticum]RAK05348.1 uncharacterized protein YhaN [Halanaerobium saccharolyticum]TDV99706.1 uncharacterized protein YhaN [Halanaerobium saccharolyticum]TDX51863.1 uncharacterized protein YhaN [Halanaerobium saccharolyticum]
MYYKNLYIRDFGIFNNQNLNNISKNLVVIGGKNRAGKSSFLKLLRYLPYGLPQNDSIPPARNQYYIEAELEKENKNYNLILNGYSSPEVLDQNQEQHTAAQLFNHLDQLSYQHLFSISLDELQHLSKIAKGKKKEKRLFSILLGAGFSELVKVPELADKYHTNAKKIGGILGDPAVASFKPYYNEIKTAEEMRDQALLEIKEFNQKREELQQSQEKLKQKKDKIENLKQRYFLLDLLKNNYLELEEIEELKAELEKEAAGPINFDSDKSNQESNTQRGLANLLSFFKSQSKKVKKQQQNEEVLKEKIKNYQLQKVKINNNLQVLISEVESLNSSWEKPLQELEKIETDLIQEQRLNKKLREYKQLTAEIEKIESDINDLVFEIEEKNLQLKDIKFKMPETILKRSYMIIALAVITLSTSFFVDYSQITYLAIIFALTAFIYYSSNYKSSKLNKERTDKIKNEIKSEKKKRKVLKQQLKIKIDQLTETEADLENYAHILGITEADYLEFIDSYFGEIKEKKRRYRELKVEERDNKEKRKELEENLKQLNDLIFNAAVYCSHDFNTTAEMNLINKSQTIFKDFNILVDIWTLSEEYLSKKSQLEYILKSSDKIKNALNEKNGEEDYYQSFISLYGEFSSMTAVEERKRELSEQLNFFKEEKSSLEEKITTLKNRIDDLSSSSKIEKAQQKIDQAQNNLEKKARNYAVNKSVNFILKKLRSRMIEKAEKELLEPASEILSRISSQYYTDLKTPADLDQSDFKVITENGKVFNSVQQLSRGSLEQLFLAVRISRIREIKPALPLVLDDSLVNFDRSHLYNTAEIISNLASQHQIFILSCHPHLVSFISRITDSAQYWKLEEGKFELSDQEKLLDHLSY